MTQHMHYWQIENIEKWSSDRFHIDYVCSCGRTAVAAHGIEGKHGIPRVMDKLLPGREVHWLVGPEEAMPPSG